MKPLEAKRSYLEASKPTYPPIYLLNVLILRHFDPVLWLALFQRNVGMTYY